jgi:hypothetical protein
MHPATIDLQDGESYRVRLLSGRHRTATPAPGVSPKLLHQCLCSRRTVVVADGEHGLVILGALQAEPTPSVDPSGTFEVAAREIRLAADATVVLTTGKASLTLDHSGVTRVEGGQMVIDLGSLLKVLASRVELP